MFKQSLRRLAQIGSEQGGSSNSNSQRLSIFQVGVPHAPYVPPRWSRLSPIMLSSPKQFTYALWAKLKLWAMNWAQVYNFRSDMRSGWKGYKPNFLLWKNNAIETFVDVNTAFANKKVSSVHDKVCNFVYESLLKRQASLPKNTLVWQLVKFNSKPKLISFNSFPNHDGSVLMCQIIYKFDTRQKWLVKQKNEFVPKERDVVEYLAFNVNPYDNSVCLAGSVFESSPKRVLESKVISSQSETILYMKKNSDIFRSEPSDEEKLLEK